MALADQLLESIQEFAPGLELKYNKVYIGLGKDGQPNNFVVFRPKKSSLNLSIKLKRSDEIETRIEGSGLDTMEYDKRGGWYRLRLAPQDPKKHAAVLKELMQLAWENRMA